MSDTVILALTAKTSLLEIARQARALGEGLQNAAPGEQNAPNRSVQYLLSVADMLTESANACAALESVSPSMHRPGT